MKTSLIVLTTMLAVAGCSAQDATSPAGATPAASASARAAPAKDPEKARSLIASGAVVLDVRTPEEFATGHLDTAKNIPVDGLADKMSDVQTLVGGDKSKPIVVYCAKGGRAAKAKAALEANGFSNVVNGGGYDDLR